MMQLATLRRAIEGHLPHGAAGRRAWLACGILAASVLISASIFATGPSPTPQIKTEKAWPVSVLTVTPADLAPSFATYGRVESTQVAHLQSNLGAEITAVHVREG
jgi:multidrug efflux pump subunit AcrA (membrane-fusion protein)